METSPDHPPSLLTVIAGAGLIIGILDLLDAIIFFAYLGVAPIKIPQSIASGFLGRLSYADGMVSASFGVILHFLIAFSIAAIYILLSGELPLSRKPMLSGSLYGVSVYFFMNYVVIPLSDYYPRPQFAPKPFANGIIGHIVLVGIPLAFIARRYVPGPEPAR